MTSDMPYVRQTRLDSYVDRYAARTKGMTASEIRALFAVASRPEVVSLAGGMQNIAGLPLLAWTVRSDADRTRAGRWADQMIFEGFRP